jgi:hypothetical protein
MGRDWWDEEDRIGLQALCCLKLALRLSAKFLLEFLLFTYEKPKMSNCRVDLCNSWFSDPRGFFS